MDRAAAIILTKKALRITTAAPDPQEKFKQMDGTKLVVTLQTRGGNTLARVHGTLKIASEFKFQLSGGGKIAIIDQPYRKPDKVYRQERSIIMEDGDLRWIIG